MFAKLFILIISITLCLAACGLPSLVTLGSTATTLPPPTATAAPLELQKVETFPSECSNMIQGLPGEGLAEVAYLPSGFCFHGELDIFETGGRTAAICRKSNIWPASLHHPARIIYIF